MNSAVVLCAGRGKRMKSDTNKMYMEIGDRPIALLTIEKMLSIPEVDEVVAVISKDDECTFKERVLARIESHKTITIAYGGKERQDSVLNGLKMVTKECDIVLIHDGARPFVDEDTVKRTIECAGRTGACAAGVPSKDTIKVVDGEGGVVKTPDRSTLWCVQTPQTFRFKNIKRAYEKAASEGFKATDDCMIAENAGDKVSMVMGSYENIKVTTPEDITFANAIMKRRNEMRVGIGYDVHRLEKGRKLIIGGVDIPFDRGLLGHSDADVLTHAIMDSLLGAAALGDIGRHFPDSDAQYEGACSIELLRRVGEILKDEGYKVVNVDSVVVAQAPKLFPYMEEIKKNICSALNVENSRVNIKATTTEKLGFEGRGEGISAKAVSCVDKI